MLVISAKQEIVKPINNERFGPKNATQAAPIKQLKALLKTHQKNVQFVVPNRLPHENRQLKPTDVFFQPVKIN